MGLWPCSCPISSDERILESARRIFSRLGADGRPVYEFGSDPEGRSLVGGDGTVDRDGNGRYEIDCSHLVVRALLEAGYFPPLTATYLMKGLGISTEKLIQKEWDWYKSIFFCEVPIEEAGPGDIMVFQAEGQPRGHMGIMSQKVYDEQLGIWVGTIFHSGSSTDGPGTRTWVDDPSGNWPLGGKELRPSQLPGTVHGWTARGCP
ncbi:MAG: hypothetical protein AB1733_18695 [Thermodesulfobacteriota bacterium]